MIYESRLRVIMMALITCSYPYLRCSAFELDTGDRRRAADHGKTTSNARASYSGGRGRRNEGVVTGRPAAQQFNTSRRAGRFTAPSGVP